MLRIPKRNADAAIYLLRQMRLRKRNFFLRTAIVTGLVLGMFFCITLGLLLSPKGLVSLLLLTSLLGFGFLFPSYWQARQQNLYFQKIIEQGEAGIALWRQSRLLYSNRAYRSLLGIAENISVTGRTLEQIDHLSKMAMKPIEGANNETWEDGQYRLERLQLSDNVKAHFLTHILSKKRDKQDTTALQASLALSQKQEKTLQARLKKLEALGNHISYERDRAERSASSTSHFVTNIAHELRTPLNAIIGFAQIMERELFGPIGTKRYQEYAADIAKSSNHLLMLINDLLDIARIEAGRHPVEMEPISARSALEENRSLLAQRAEKKQIEIKIFTKESLHIMADPRALRQILLNLTANAIRFTDKGGRIILSAEPQDKMICFSVQDNGAGISKKDIARLGKPFRQASDTKDGTGLGLALSRSLTERHGGEMQIKSEKGKGSIFSFTLPKAN